MAFVSHSQAICLLLPKSNEIGTVPSGFVSLTERNGVSELCFEDVMNFFTTLIRMSRRLPTRGATATTLHLNLTPRIL